MKVFQMRARGERRYIIIVLSFTLMSLIVLTRTINQPESEVILPIGTNLVSSAAAKAEPSKTGVATKKILEVKSPLNSAATDSIDYPLLQSLLNQIQFDEKGNLLLQENARQQLDAAITLMGFDRSSTELRLLDDAVAAYLPNEKARQVNDLLARYYQYKLAEFDYIHANESTSPEDTMKAYAMLQDLRRSYLGGELAAQLFAQEDRFMDYTISRLMLDQDKTITPEQRQQRVESLEKNYTMAHSIADE